MVIWKQQARIMLEKAKKKMTVVEEENKTRGQSLELARQALSKHEIPSSMVIASAVANAVALFKNHQLDLDMEILRKDFTIDDAEREALAGSAYEATHVLVFFAPARYGVVKIARSYFEMVL
jgi:hypothetical protein